MTQDLSQSDEIIARLIQVAMGKRMSKLVRRELAKTTRLVSDLGLSFPVAIARGDDLNRSYMVYGLPSTALIDANGRIVAYGVGDVGGKQVMEQALALLRE